MPLMDDTKPLRRCISIPSDDHIRTVLSNDPVTTLTNTGTTTIIHAVWTKCCTTVTLRYILYKNSSSCNRTIYTSSEKRKAQL